MSALLASVYVFVAFFAVHLHQHKSSLELRDFQLQKAADSLTDSGAVLDYSDCLACHLLHDSSNLVPQEFQFYIYNIKAVQETTCQAFSEISTQWTAVVTLRGPPSVFI